MKEKWEALVNNNLLRGEKHVLQYGMELCGN